MPPTPRHRMLVARTITGEVIDELTPETWTAVDALAWADSRSLTCDVTLPGRGRVGTLVRASLRSIAAAMRANCLVLVRERTALWAGPVTSLGWDAEKVSMSAAGVQWLLDRRMAMQPGGLAVPATVAADLTLSLPPADRAVALLQAATTGPRRTLPLTLPALSGAAGDTVTYRGADLRTAYEAVREIVEADGGPDVLIQPVISDDLSQLSWSVTVGHLGGPNPDAVWDFPLAALAGDIDDSETVDRAYVQGSGSSEDTPLIGTAAGPITAVDVPAVERTDRTSTSETRPEQLDALATSYSREYGTAVEELETSVPTDAGPQYRTGWNLGDNVRFPVTDHPWLEDLDVVRRVVAVNLTPARCAMTTTGPRITPEAA